MQLLPKNERPLTRSKPIVQVSLDTEGETEITVK